MKGMGSLIRLQRWRLDEKRRKLANLERLKADLETQIRRLETDLGREKGVAATGGAGSMTYPAYLVATLERRRTLETSLADVESQIAAAHDEVHTAFQEMKRYEIVAENQLRRQRAQIARRLQAELDEIGIDRHRRKQRDGEPS
jgi:flagellar export protein FliJ